MTPGEQIRAARRARHLTTRDLARLAGVSNGVANKVERDLTVRPGTLNKVAAALDLVVTTTVEIAPADPAGDDDSEEQPAKLAG